MMNRQPILPEKFACKAHSLWNDQWLLLSCGDFSSGHFNAMTVAWGSLGTLWGMPFAQIFVRPSRYTYEFLEKYRNFTLCAFPIEYRKALQLLGTKSGRDGNKIAEAGLTPEASHQISSPSFAEAELVIECQQMYWQDVDSSHFLDEKIKKLYLQGDYHRFYFGEVLSIWGDEKFSA